MDSLGGMDMGSSGMFTPVNEAIAHGYWYAIAGCVGLLTAIRGIRWVQSRARQKQYRHDPHCVPSRPAGSLAQAYATATATMRELAYPQPVWFSGRISRYFSPLPVGRWLILIIYWTVLLAFLWSNTILKPSDPMYAYKWEKVGFRAAWVSIAQIPFIYLLSCKFNPISILTGISYERLNWLHRWSARTVFLTIIVHWAYFFREWYLADFVEYQFQMMPMVKYGFGAWSVIGWMVLTGFGFFRMLNYEFFVVQHICAAGALLWLIHTHVPAYAAYNVWMSVGFVAFDWSVRIICGVIQNLHLLRKPGVKAPGYATTLEALPGDIVRLIVEDVDFNWKAGQHAYISIPRLRPFELHPFTIANVPHSDFTSESGHRLTMLIKAHSGFSKSLHKAALGGTDTGCVYRSFLSGPWGMPPDVLHYETVVMIACSTGASFIVPMLQEIMSKRGCVQKVTLHWIVRNEAHFAWFGKELIAVVDAAKQSGLNLIVTVHITGAATLGQHSEFASDLGRLSSGEACSVGSSFGEGSSAASINSVEREKSALFLERQANSHRPRASLTMSHGSRPTVDSMIRPSVEAAVGETAVVVCGGLSIAAQTRTLVAALSDERAVHKGTGAQGIYLFTETYGW